MARRNTGPLEFFTRIKHIAEETMDIQQEMKKSADMHNHLERLWPRFMAGECPAFEEFIAEPYESREEFYNWVCNQLGELADLDHYISLKKAKRMKRIFESENNGHFFASSAVTWATGKDPEDVVRRLRASDRKNSMFTKKLLDHHLFFVPCSEDETYEIVGNTPKVPGTVFLGTYVYVSPKQAREAAI